MNESMSCLSISINFKSSSLIKTVKMRIMCKIACISMYLCASRSCKHVRKTVITISQISIFTQSDKEIHKSLSIELRDCLFLKRINKVILYQRS